MLRMKLRRSDVHLNHARKNNSKRFIGDGIKFIRKRIESAFSVITQRFPAHIHAVTSHGFELKVFLFISWLTALKMQYYRSQLGLCVAYDLPTCFTPLTLCGWDTELKGLLFSKLFGNIPKPSADFWKFCIYLPIDI